MERINVIVPVYNAENYLQDCITSILAQSYSDFALILVNDGSTDGSLSILQDYAAKDGRILVVDKPNGGVSSARNAGLAACEGKYLVFVDADDTVERDYLSQLYQHAQEGRLTLCGFEDRAKTPPDFVFDRTAETSTLGKADFCQLYLKWLINSPCNKLYETRIIKENALSFQPGLSMGEDLLFNLDYIRHVEGFTVVNKPLYHYCHPNGQSLSRTYRPDFYEINNAQYQTLLRYCREACGIVENSALAGVYDVYLSSMLYAFDDVLTLDSSPKRTRHRKVWEFMNGTDFQNLIRHMREQNLIHPLLGYLLANGWYGMYKRLIQLHKALKK